MLYKIWDKFKIKKDYIDRINEVICCIYHEDEFPECYEKDKYIDIVKWDWILEYIPKWILTEKDLEEQLFLFSNSDFSIWMYINEVIKLEEKKIIYNI